MSIETVTEAKIIPNATLRRKPTETEEKCENELKNKRFVSFTVPRTTRVYILLNAFYQFCTSPQVSDK